jgi:hypothetical protein
MNKALARVLRDKLLDLPFIEVAAGLVQTVTTTDSVPNSAADEAAVSAVTKKFPVATSVIPEDFCKNGKEFRTIPNSNYRSLIYFEEFGISVGPKNHGHTAFTSRIRMVIWLNRKNLVGASYTDISGRCMAMIIDRLTGNNPENVDIFTRLTCEVAAILPQDASVFARYTYSEADRQYLRPPFEFFAIDFTCKYQVPSNCMDSINWNVKVC